MTGFTFVELFAGIGGVSFGFEAVGGKCVMAAEFDPQAKGRQYTQEAYKLLHPEVTDVRGDVFTIDEKSVPDHDVLSFTTPCQSFSVAGKRKGFEDTRGTLVFEALRIAKHKQPKMLFMENVKGLVGHDKGNTLDTIVQAMNEIGYTVDLTVLSSKYFGVPQSRERVFIIAVRDDLVKPEPWNIEGANVVAKGKRRISEIEGVKTFNFDYPEQTEVTTRLRDILETEVDEKYYLSDEKTAKLVAELEQCPPKLIDTPDLNMVGTLGLAGYAEMSNRVYSKEGVARTLMGGGGNAGDKTGLYLDITPNMVGHIDLKGHDAIKRVYDPEAIAPTLTAMGGGHREPKIAEEVRSCSTRTRAYAGKTESLEIRKDFVSNTITSVAKDAYVINSPKYRIRKLTPKECFRLQSFTDEHYQTLVDAGFSNSKVYRFAGNAVTVNVIHAIGERLLPYLC